MNKIRFNILAMSLAGGLCIASCSDSFLDVSSKTESTTGTFYKTENDAWRALIGCYDGWRLTTSNQGFAIYLASTVMSDECFGGTGNTDGFGYQAVDRFDLSLSPADVNLFASEWKNYYAAVYRCNQLIAYEEQIDWKDEAKRDLYMGECHALRAILYLDMVRFWGNIPLFTEPVNENREQSDPKEVFKVIFDDLNYAIAKIPADAYPKKNAAQNDGHVTKYAAEALLARAYLFYSGYYGSEPEGVTKADALAAVEDVISSGEFSLVPEYKNLWPGASAGIAEIGDSETLQGTYAGDGNVETVLAQKFSNTKDYNGNEDGNRWLVMMGMRKISFAPYGNGWGGCTVNPLFVQKYANGDTRLAASVIDIEGEGISKTEGFDMNHKKDQREYTGFTVKKYTPLCFKDGKSASKIDGSGDFQTSQHQDYVVMRYADVLLMAAELGSPNAQTYFNSVRERAYTTGIDDSGAPVLSSKYSEVAVSKEAILNERALEFAFEGLRYYDLLRQGIDYAANAIALSGVDVLSGGNPATVSISAENVRKTKGLAQIPETQITLSNGVLKQNDGWK